MPVRNINTPNTKNITPKKLIEFPGASPITAPVGDGELPASNNPVKKNNAARTLVLSI